MKQTACKSVKSHLQDYSNHTFAGGVFYLFQLICIGQMLTSVVDVVKLQQRLRSIHLIFAYFRSNQIRSEKISS